MPLTAQLLTRGPLAGPAVLDLLSHAARDSGELALLHSSNHSGSSVLAVNPVLTIEVDHTATARWISHQGISSPPMPHTQDPITSFQSMLAAVTLLPAATSLPLIGWIGGISYDIARHIENIGNSARDDEHWPLIRFTLFDDYFYFEPQSERWTVATFEWNRPRRETAAARLERLARALASVEGPREIPKHHATLLEQTSGHAYRANVRRAQEYIAAGDIYQANVARRWTVHTDEAPELIYKRLCAQSPAAFGAFFRFEDRAVLSASPELFLDRRGDHLLTQPIKGTRPRDLADPVRDELLKEELWASAKDKAELAMIVDLLRNDLGRVCRYGSVQVVDARLLEKLPTVWHTLARIEGRLAAEITGAWAVILRALCPGGSVTGAPKIRAMQIIEELEGFRRGWYCGNIGWIGPEGTGTLNIAIRTILMQGQTAQVWAGAGIVADSEEEMEHLETLVKARAMLRALGVATL